MQHIDQTFQSLFHLPILILIVDIQLLLTTLQQLYNQTVNGLISCEQTKITSDSLRQIRIKVWKSKMSETRRTIYESSMKSWPGGKELEQRQTCGTLT